MNKQKGFTIIELIVVVAIIAVLAGIVMVSVVTYINKGKNAAIIGNLDTITKGGTIYFASNNSYTGGLEDFCDSSYVTGPRSAIINAGSNEDEFRCRNSDGTWCACATLLGGSNDTFCVDYTGYKKEINLEGVFCDSRCKDEDTKYCADE